MALDWQPPVPETSPLRGHTHSQQVVTDCSSLLQKVLCFLLYLQLKITHYIQYNTDPSFLTCPHSDPSPTNWAVSLGSVLRSGVGALVFPIHRVIIHPAFNSTNMDHDLALLELLAPAPMSFTIQSVCLPSPVHRFLRNVECYITGWGSMREGGERCTADVNDEDK